MTGLAIEGLRVAYGRRPVRRDVSVPALQPGTVTALLGPNAPGKSTRLRGITGLKRARRRPQPARRPGDRRDGAR